jgi:hypothetical protein
MTEVRLCQLGFRPAWERFHDSQNRYLLFHGRMRSSGMWRHVRLVRTYVSEEHVASIFIENSPSEESISSWLTDISLELGSCTGLAVLGLPVLFASSLIHWHCQLHILSVEWDCLKLETTVYWNVTPFRLIAFTDVAKSLRENQADNEQQTCVKCWKHLPDYTA